MPQFETSLIEFCNHLLASYEKFSGEKLLSENTADSIEKLYRADFILLAHKISNDPIFCFANQEAQKLWEMDWDEFTKTPSRLSAPENARSERQSLLDAASQKNIISGGNGIRVSKSGRLFHIKNVTLWNIFDADNQLIGQAAKFAPDLIEYI